MTVRALLVSVSLVLCMPLAALAQPPAAPVVAPAPGQPDTTIAPAPGQPALTIIPAPGQPAVTILPTPGHPAVTIAPVPGQPDTTIAPPSEQAAAPVKVSPGQTPPAVPPAQTPRPALPQPRQTAPAPGTPPPQPQPGPPPPARREGQAVNVKVDVTITDQRGGAAAAKKTVSVVTADGMSGFIRSQASYFNIGDVPLNVDTEPFLLPDGKIRVRVNLQYELPAPPGTPQNEVGAQAGTLRKTSIHENLSLILESGKSLVAAQSADPVGDRQVTIEVKATVLR